MSEASRRCVLQGHLGAAAPVQGSRAFARAPPVPELPLRFPAPSACASAPTAFPGSLRYCKDKARWVGLIQALGKQVLLGSGDLEQEAHLDPSDTCSWEWGWGSGTQDFLPFPS